ncbi:hypothetical protein PG985_015582 [Apiospora marii]|uniref:Uncharacterized protein n=1 Tax=Apiospora marii TaxID=335849 RepID=A0ABR1S6F5_9PEZI
MQRLSLYDLSELILDLEAEGNKHVRKYDPTTDGAPDPLRTVDNYEQLALTRRVQRFEDRYLQDSQQSDDTDAQEYNPWHVSDLDIISYTLLASSRFGDITDTVHRCNGIPHHAQEDVARGVPYLMHRQKKHKKAAADPDVLSIDTFARQIQEHGTLTEMRRATQILLARPGGCKLIGRPYSSAIASRCAKLESVMSWDELKDLAVFLNDVTIRLASEEIPIPSNLAGMGLRTAAFVGAFPAMQMYFGVFGNAWKHKHMTRCVNEALERVLLFLTSQPGHNKDQYGAQETRASRVAAYTTLTGHSMRGQHYGASFQKILRTEEKDLFSHHRHLLHILGELGAFRTIWHIAQKSVQEDTPLIPSECHHWFAIAVMRARRNVQSGRITFAPESVEHGTGDYEADCKLDIQTIMDSSIDAGPTEATGSNYVPRREKPSLNHEVSVLLHHNIGPRTTPKEWRLGVMEALRISNITAAMSRLMKIIHEPEPS